MNSTPALSPAAALMTGLLLIGSTGAAHGASTPQTRPRATTPCLVSADRIADYRQAGLPLGTCVRAHQPRHETAPPELCLVVADRIEQWIALGQKLPTCVRRLQRTASTYRD